MSIKKLRFSDPFYTIEFIDNEMQYKINDTSIVINLGERGILVKDKALGNLKSTIIRNVAIKDIQRALVIDDYERNRDHAVLFSEIQKQWPLMYETTRAGSF